MIRWRNNLAAALTASICLFGFTADAAAKPGKAGRKGDHQKLDGKLKDRSGKSGLRMSRTIVVLYPGCDLTAAYRKSNGRLVRQLNIINADVVELPNGQLRKLAENPCVESMHWDRRTGGEMNRAAVVEGARAVQEQYGYDGAGIGVAVIDSGTAYHLDLGYRGSNAAVKVVNGARTEIDDVRATLTGLDGWNASPAEARIGSLRKRATGTAQFALTAPAAQEPSSRRDKVGHCRE